MSRKAKGITGVPGLLVFALVVAITIAVIYIISIIPLVNNVISINAEAQFQVIQDDSATALASFLSLHSYSCGNYVEVLGSRAASNFPESGDSCLVNTLSKMTPNGRIAVFDDAGNLKKGYNGDGSNSILSADLALPGGKTGEVKVS